MASQKQIDADRQNAQKSSGPITPEGKAAVSQNAFTHGLTAELACINGEDMDEFDETRQSFENELKPVGPVQTLLVQQIVMAAWRLARLAFLFRQDVRGPNALTILGRYEARVQRSFYRALHELQRLQAGPQNNLTKQSQITPETEQQQDFTPPPSPSFVPSCLCGEPPHLLTSSL